MGERKIYISNLVLGLDMGLDDIEFLKSVTSIADNVGIEFFVHTYSEYYMKKMKNVAQWIGDIPVALHGPFICIEACSKVGSEEYNKMINAYDETFALASKLNAKSVVFHTNQKVIEEFDKAEMQARCKSVIKILIDKAEKYNLHLLIENLGMQTKGLCLFDENEFIALSQEFIKAYFVIDIGHLHIAKWNLENVISKLGNRVSCYHLHNNDGQSDTHCKILNGTFDYSKFFMLYNKYTPTADLTLEYADKPKVSICELRKDVQYILKQLNR